MLEKEKMNDKDPAVPCEDHGMFGEDCRIIGEVL